MPFATCFAATCIPSCSSPLPRTIGITIPVPKNALPRFSEHAEIAKQCTMCTLDKPIKAIGEHQLACAKRVANSALAEEAAPWKNSPEHWIVCSGSVIAHCDQWCAGAATERVSEKARKTNLKIASSRRSLLSTVERVSSLIHTIAIAPTGTVTTRNIAAFCEFENFKLENGREGRREEGEEAKGAAASILPQSATREDKGAARSETAKAEEAAQGEAQHARCEQTNKHTNTCAIQRIAR
jgi:hypothetical protein